MHAEYRNHDDVAKLLREAIDQSLGKSDGEGLYQSTLYMFLLHRTYNIRASTCTCMWQSLEENEHYSVFN